MTRPMRWYWWAAVVLVGITLASLAASFVWVFGWTDSQCQYYVYLEHGMLCGNPNVTLPGETVDLSWYGYFEVFRSPIYEPWTAFPRFDLSDWSFKCPIHLALVVLVPIVASPFAIRWLRRKHGLCVRCGYNLTGNTSGICSECGEPTTRKE